MTNLHFNLSLTAKKTNLNGCFTCSLAQFWNKKLTFPANKALNLPWFRLDETAFPLRSMLLSNLANLVTCSAAVAWLPSYSSVFVDQVVFKDSCTSLVFCLSSKAALMSHSNWKGLFETNMFDFIILSLKLWTKSPRNVLLAYARSKTLRFKFLSLLDVKQ